MEKEIRNKSSNMEEEQSLAVMGLVAVDAHLTAGFLARWFQSQSLRWGGGGSPLAAPSPVCKVHNEASTFFYLNLKGVGRAAERKGGAASLSPLSLNHLERLLHIWSLGRWAGGTQCGSGEG